MANREIKGILEKVVGSNRKDWALKLDDALWAYQTSYKTPIGTTLFLLIYGKSCHLSVELKHKAWWGLTKLNLDQETIKKKRLAQLRELEELGLDVFQSAKLYKERAKK